MLHTGRGEAHRREEGAIRQRKAGVIDQLPDSTGWQANDQGWHLQTAPPGVVGLTVGRPPRQDAASPAARPHAAAGGWGVVGVVALVRGDQHARVAAAALHLLAHVAARVCALVVAARVRVALDNLLAVLAPPGRGAAAAGFLSLGALTEAMGVHGAATNSGSAWSIHHLRPLATGGAGKTPTTAMSLHPPVAVIHAIGIRLELNHAALVAAAAAAASCALCCLGAALCGRAQRTGSGGGPLAPLGRRYELGLIPSLVRVAMRHVAQHCRAGKERRGGGNPGAFHAILPEQPATLWQLASVLAALPGGGPGGLQARGRSHQLLSWHRRAAPAALLPSRSGLPLRAHL